MYKCFTQTDDSTNLFKSGEPQRQTRFLLWSQSMPNKGKVKVDKWQLVPVCTHKMFWSIDLNSNLSTNKTGQINRSPVYCRWAYVVKSRGFFGPIENFVSL